MKEYKINMEVVINGQKVRAGYTFLESIVGDIPDVKENTKIFNLLSLSDNYAIRDAISSKDCLSKDTINILLNDESDNIIRNILTNSWISRYITTEQILSIIEKDNVKLITTILQNLDSYKKCDKFKIINLLAKHRSTLVKASLLLYPVRELISTELLEELSNDDDFDVSTEAKKELKDRLKDKLKCN